MFSSIKNLSNAFNQNEIKLSLLLVENNTKAIPNIKSNNTILNIKKQKNISQRERIENKIEKWKNLSKTIQNKKIEKNEKNEKLVKAITSTKTKKNLKPRNTKITTEIKKKPEMEIKPEKSPVSTSKKISKQFNRRNLSKQYQGKEILNEKNDIERNGRSLERWPSGFSKHPFSVNNGFNNSLNSPESMRFGQGIQNLSQGSLGGSFPRGSNYQVIGSRGNHCGYPGMQPPSMGLFNGSFNRPGVRGNFYSARGGNGFW